MSKITENIFIGDWHNAQDLNFLKRHNITHILCLASELREIFKKKFVYKKLAIVDNQGFKIINFLDEATDFIQMALNTKRIHDSFSKKKSKNTVFVHCSDGISRSSTVVIAFLMKFHKLNFETAFSIVKKSRKKAMPNLGFVIQLRKFEKKLQKNWKIMDFIEKSKEKGQESEENLKKKKQREDLFIETVFQRNQSISSSRNSKNNFKMKMKTLETGDQVTSQFQNYVIPRLSFPNRLNSRRNSVRSKSKSANYSRRNSREKISNIMKTSRRNSEIVNQNEEKEATALVIRLPGAARSRNNSFVDLNSNRKIDNISRGKSDKSIGRLFGDCPYGDTDKSEGKSNKNNSKYWKLRKPRSNNSTTGTASGKYRRKKKSGFKKRNSNNKNKMIDIRNQIKSRSRSRGNYYRKNQSRSRSPGFTAVLKHQEPLPSERKLAILKEPIKDLISSKSKISEKTSNSRSRSRSGTNYTRIFGTYDTFGMKNTLNSNNRSSNDFPEKKTGAFTLAANSRKEVFRRRRSLEGDAEEEFRETSIDIFVTDLELKSKKTSQKKIKNRKTSKSRSKSRYRNEKSKKKIVAKLKENYSRSRDTKKIAEKFTFGLKKSYKKSKSKNKGKKLKNKSTNNKRNFDGLREALGLNHKEEEEDYVLGVGDRDACEFDKENLITGNQGSYSFKQFSELGQNQAGGRRKWFDC